jgi:type II secretory pathway pseudopilin PulG
MAECGFGNARRPPRRSPLGASGSRGVIYPILLISILVIGVATTGVAELWSTQIKREKEEELLFRLGEFRRAIAGYRAAHNSLPKELKDLLLDRSQLQTRRYLRQVYSDPMTGKPDWKLDLVMDRTGAVSGIQDVHSRSKETPLKVLSLKQANTYQDW